MDKIADANSGFTWRIANLWQIYLWLYLWKGLKPWNKTRVWTIQTPQTRLIIWLKRTLSDISKGRNWEQIGSWQMQMSTMNDCKRCISIDMINQTIWFSYFSYHLLHLVSWKNPFQLHSLLLLLLTILLHLWWEDFCSSIDQSNKSATDLSLKKELLLHWNRVNHWEYILQKNCPLTLPWYTHFLRRHLLTPLLL